MRGVDYVFSAAALKQVPSCEFYPLEAVNTNIVGTANTIGVAVAHKVQKVVALRCLVSRYGGMVTLSPRNRTRQVGVC